MAVRRLHALRRPPYKVAVVDADNTLWTGVCGEDGPEGVVIDGPRRALQEFLLKQREAGMLLALCSKNEAADVDAVFAAHPDMPLRPGHLAASRVSWNAKSDGLLSLAEELGLGLDSFVFLDDNPVEIADVQARCPGVVCLRVPEDPRQIPAWLRHLWAFDRPKVTAEDRARAESYRQNREREALRQGAPSLEAFLESLGLVVDVRPVAPEHLPRVAQLTQRTNQFNLSLVRRTEAEVGRFLAGGGEGLEVSVRDRFGDYGLVGVALFTRGSEALAVDTMLLSCRVLGRGVEHRLLASLVEIAAGRGLARVDLPWVPGDRNRPALEFLERLAGASREGTTYRVPVDTREENV
jgi:FkbH-like protein